MDFATIIGLIGGMLLIGVAITSGSDAMLFVSIPSIMIVLGGTIAATLIKFPLKQCFNSVKVAVNAFRHETTHPHELIHIANEMATIARKNGVIALDGYEVHDRFFKRAAQMVADGYKPEFVEQALREDMEQTQERHEIGQRMFRAIGESAPAFGMIGTLVGLIQMLNTLDDPANIGPAMAIALLTTLYGALIANLIALPIADNLELRSQQERLNHMVIISSIAAIQQGQNPRLMDELLEAYLPVRERELLQAEVNKPAAERKDDE